LVFALKEKNAGKLDSHTWLLLRSFRRTLFEYKISNILYRSTGSAFGFINVLPGVFSAYRHGSVKTKEHPLTGEPEGLLVRSLHLSEDRILCFEIVAQRERCTTATPWRRPTFPRRSKV
jgi:cellulose synthase/poly-beta-1,6-N-acetylglucosamine synthase-like glycosyltransferase